MNIQWIKDLNYYDQIPIEHRLFLTRYKSYQEFLNAYKELCKECYFFCIDIPKTERGKSSPLGVIELMVYFEQLGREYQ